MNGHDVMTITQGDQYPIGVRLEDENGESITDADVSCVTISLGDIVHKSTDETLPVTYDAEEELWIFDVTQAETLGLVMGVHQLSAEVVFIDGSITNASVAAVYTLPRNGGE